MAKAMEMLELDKVFDSTLLEDLPLSYLEKDTSLYISAD